MAETERELQRDIDLLVETQRKGLAMMTVGWILIGMDFLLALYVLIGVRSGSYMWLWWVLIEGTLGFGLIFAGSHLRSKSGPELRHEEQEKRAA